MSDQIVPILMPKWGLSMKVGTLAAWHVEEGTQINPGDEIMDVETDKIANVVEAADGGLLRRCVGTAGEIYPVQALLGVLAPASVSDAEIDAYVAAFEMPEVEEDGEEAPSHQTADLEIGRIRYLTREGEGTPVIFIHGFGGDSDNWLFNVDAVAADAPVYALDLPGHGGSVKSIDNPGLGTMVTAVIQLMDHLSIEKAHLVGHSMGGLVSGQTAIDHVGRVASLTLICSAGLGDEINPDYIGGFVSAASRKELKPVLKHLFADDSLVSRSMVDDLLKYKRLDGVQAFLDALKGNLFSQGKQGASIAAGVAASGVPTTVIWGAEDAVIPPSHASAISGAKVEVIADAGHMVMMENAARVNELIKAQL
ncbi:acetoin dehydrogenase dihydrolipoyllysine-residue acetyltransferase subunit [Ruegeria pomeroyi]|nr:acetoin dehydrogenase dihydrolipoyllysine-residue acetyltransferase subunit [Ruegeria pomeroyi]